ncbi:hypothetical protein DYBT9275_01170 [Dyadobacter sp. CECT 9275]|uniref:Outer membrane protein beta-barrel domain-containing protein n=1 Tax=Dyadobacter helix TaxID=2822344 RepID=A0A916JBJ2_9BACT|nr:hypothetical protein [Dyadobacter sp. CECT 9275]CAG4993440.1 hypothetical protein DYBT9275_01170 [Dyadobacter sp. CECT 9275]
MKTDKFEKTIRRKLESISPEFHEDDWNKMQQYMQVHTPPGFWQQYSSWLGYAAAAAVTTVVSLMYINQLDKNNELVADVKNLKSRIEVIQNTPAAAGAVKTDTVYIVQKELVPQPYLVAPGKGEDQQEITDNEIDKKINNVHNEFAAKESAAEREVSPSQNLTDNATNPSLQNGNLVPDESRNTDKVASSQTGIRRKENSHAVANRETSSGRETVRNENADSGSRLTETEQKDTGIPDPTVDYQRPRMASSQLVLRQPVQQNSAERTAYSMNYALLNRISPKQVRKAIQGQTSAVSSRENIAKTTTAPTAEQKVNRTNQAENVIPQLPLKTPYRFGGGIQFEGKNQAKSVVAEVLVGKKFSISTGVSWLKVKPMDFFTEKIFREKNKKDFKRSHPDQVPFAVDVRNINVKPTLVQIPLTVAFRNSVNKDLDYYVSAGTNVTVRAKEQYSFDCIPPSPGPIIFFNKSFEKKSDMPLINSLNFALGIEKSWHPIVLQAEGYLYTYFTPLSPSSAKTGPGVRFKLLYQIGKKM